MGVAVRVALATAILAATAQAGPAVKAIGHRGAAGHAPENTLAALAVARELGVSEVEVDVQLSRDGVPVLFHDRTLDAKTDLSGPVAAHPAARLVEAEIGSWFDTAHPGSGRRWAGTRLATLDAALARHGADFHWHLELKSDAPELPARLLASIARFGLAGRATLTSFHLRSLERVRALDASIPVCWLIERLPGRSDAARAAPDADGLARQRAAVDRAAERGFAMLGIAAGDLGPEIVAYAGQRGVAVRAWGIRDDRDMRHALDAGVVGMTLDRPERLLALLAENGSDPARPAGIE